MPSTAAREALNGPRKAAEAALKVADLLTAVTLVKAAKMARIDALAVRLSRHPDSAVRRYSASHGLWRGSAAVPVLARDGDPKVRRNIASSSTLHRGEDTTLLALDARPEVRVAVAARHDIAEPTATLLTRDTCEEVRLALAHNSHITYPTLDRLVHDRDARVREAAANHPNALPYHKAIAGSIGRMLDETASSTHAR